jgi:hypothetical protein
VKAPVVDMTQLSSADRADVLATLELARAMAALAGSASRGDLVIAFNALVTAAMIAARSAPTPETTAAMLTAGRDNFARAIELHGKRHAATADAPAATEVMS